MTNKFLEIHTLTSYASALLNRDDAGFAKRIPFGGAVRTRVSSQCLKRHWRVYDGDHALKTIEDAPGTVRSRHSFEKFVVQALVDKHEVPLETARVAATKIIGQLFGGDAKAEKVSKSQTGGKGGKKTDASSTSGAAGTDVPEAKTSQVTLLGEPELNYLAELAREACVEAANDAKKVGAAVETRMKSKDLKKNLQALRPGSLEAGLGAALFGRMVTGDILARVDAAVHVAHAFTVHAQQSESDYFSAIDDLMQEEGEQGSGHINASELTSGLFYGYVVLDLALLRHNLGPDNAGLAQQVIECLVHMIATVSPGAKKGSTAPYAYSQLVMVEAGSAQPRTLANAFIEPVRTAPNVITSAYGALSRYLDEERDMYGRQAVTRFAAMGLGETKLPGERLSMTDLAQWTSQQGLA